MKVLVYTTLFPNHLQPNNAIFIKQRMFHFAGLKDCQIKVVAPVPYFPQIPFFKRWSLFSQIRKWETMEGIEVYHPRYPLIPKISMPFHGIALFLASLPLVKKIYRQFPFDIIDGHYIYPDGLAAVLLGKTIGKPVVLSARGSDINQFSSFKIITPMIRYALRSADHLISVCDALGQEMAKLGADNNKIRVIPNGVDTTRFYPLPKDEARRQLGIQYPGKVIVSIGSLIPRKGFHIILDAIPLLRRVGIDPHLYIIGEGPFRSELEQKIKNLGISDRVTLKGERPNEELRIWYGAADVFCLASSREGWANVIMESLACGTPVVATNVWGAPEIITSEKVGTLVERTPESIAAGLQQALKKSWVRDEIVSHVSGRTWLTVAKEVEETFSRILYSH
ncbi:MAG: glycosyltransferase family 4 protein [Syntrophaceae bacterium]|nr:glycosyltransferase family 4 protein [Syntrophaceae bacterium]